jgi:hypothetical protein
MSKTKRYTAAFKVGSVAYIRSREETAMRQAAHVGVDPRNSADTQGERWAELVRRAEARGVTVKMPK